MLQQVFVVLLLLPLSVTFDWRKYIQPDFLSRNFTEAESRLLNAVYTIQGHQGISAFDFFLPFPPPPVVPVMFIRIQRPPDLLLPLIIMSFVSNNVMIFPVPGHFPCPICPVLPLVGPSPPSTTLSPTTTHHTSVTSQTATTPTLITTQTTATTETTATTRTRAPTTTQDIPTTTKCPPLEPAPAPDFPPLNCSRSDLLCRINPDQPSIRYNIGNLHNIRRRSITASDMKKMEWNDLMFKSAQSHANTCSFAKQETEIKLANTVCGQTILRSSTVRTWDAVVKTWFDTRNTFKYGEPSPGAESFMQIVWSTSNKVGCGVTNCTGEIFYVCNYCPAGNTPDKANKPYTPGKTCATCECDCENSLCVEADNDD